MEVETFVDARGFSRCRRLVSARRRGSQQPHLGVTGAALDDPNAFDGFEAWVLSEAGNPVAAAVRTPPHNLILAVARLAVAVHRLAEEIVDVPGVVGVAPWVHHFVEAWPEGAKLTMAQGVFQLEWVIPPPQIAGVSRPARSVEIDQLVALRLAFEEEAVGRVEDPSIAREARSGV